MAQKMPRILKDTTSLVKLIAYIDIVITSLLLFVVCIFTLTWLIAPESFTDDADEEIAAEIKDFAETEEWKQWTILMLLTGFWVVLLLVSIGLRHWTIKRDVRGLRVWLVVRAALIVITLPLDTIWLLRSGKAEEFPVGGEQEQTVVAITPNQDYHEEQKEIEEFEWAAVRNTLLFLIAIYSYLLFTMLVVFFFIRSIGRRRAEGDHQVVEFHTQSTIVEAGHN